MEDDNWVADFMLDIRTDFERLLSQGNTINESKVFLAEEYMDALDDIGYAPVYWFVLAELLWERGKLTTKEKEYALSWLDDIEDWEEWKTDYPELEAIRKKIVTNNDDT